MSLTYHYHNIHNPSEYGCDIGSRRRLTLSAVPMLGLLYLQIFLAFVPEDRSTLGGFLFSGRDCWKIFGFMRQRTEESNAV